MRISVALLVLAMASCTAAKPTRDDAGARDASADAAQGDGGSCEPGSRDCDPGDSIACETHVWTDEASCGACGNECADDELCVAGACERPLIRDVSLGAGHTCVVTTSERVLCWGRNSRGQLGDGTFSEIGERDRPHAVAVLEIDDAVAVRADNYSTCAIRGDARVVECWGDNRPARFGPQIDARSLYVRPEPLLMEGAAEMIEEVSLSGAHVCVRTSTRALCAGDNGAGRLGRPMTITDTTALAAVEGVPGGAPRDVATGGPSSYGHTCVATSDGSVYCFGNNDDRQCGQDDLTQIATPTQVAGLTDVVDVEAGTAFTCALESDGEVYCWGQNTSGQLGNGTVGPRVAAPARVGGLPPIGQLSAGGQFVLAVSADGEQVWAWGEGGSGQLGRGDLSDVPAPVLVLGGSSVTYQAHAGSVHACILERRGTTERLLCAGSNGYGELGRADPGTVAAFEPIEALP